MNKNPSNEDNPKKTLRQIRHDLKTPLAVISGYAQLITKKYEGTDSKEERWGKEIYSEVNRLVDMINTLLSDDKKISAD